jgi:hypothetical protein
VTGCWKLVPDGETNSLRTGETPIQRRLAGEELIRLHHKWVEEDDLSHEEVQDKMREFFGLRSVAPPEAQQDENEHDVSGRAIASIAYQICGVLDAPARILDYFSAVASGASPANPLPFSPNEVAPPEAERQQESE